MAKFTNFIIIKFLKTPFLLSNGKEMNTPFHFHHVSNQKREPGKKSRPFRLAE